MSAALVWTWALASARLFGLLRVQAAWASALGRSWQWISLVLAAVLGAVLLGSARLKIPLAGGVLDDGITALAMLALELMLGSVIGLVLSLPGWALVGAATHSEHGLQLRMRDDQARGSVAGLLVVASLAAGLSLRLHHPLIAGSEQLFARLALAAPGSWAGALLELDALALAGLCAELTIFALALATPVLLSSAIVSVALAALARGSDEAASLSAALDPGLRLAAALVALGAAWTAYSGSVALAL